MLWKVLKICDWSWPVHWLLCTAVDWCRLYTPPHTPSRTLNTFFGKIVWRVDVQYFHSAFQPFIRRVVKLPFLPCSSLLLTLFVALSGGILYACTQGQLILRLCVPSCLHCFSAIPHCQAHHYHRHQVMSVHIFAGISHLHNGQISQEFVRWLFVLGPDDCPTARRIYCIVWMWRSREKVNIQFIQVPKWTSCERK